MPKSSTKKDTSPSTTQLPPLRFPVLAAALVGIVACSVNANALDGAFLFDDKGALLSNKDVDGSAPLWQIFRNDFWGHPVLDADSHKSYRPLTILSFRINHWWAGGFAGQQRSFHIVNVALHAANSVLFFLTALAVLRGATRVASDAAALAAALLFSVHPVHADAVASIVGRAEPLCTFFSLCAILCYMRALHAPASTPAPTPAVLPAVLLAYAAMLSKEQGIMTLPACAAYDVLFEGGALDCGVIKQLRAVLSLDTARMLPRISREGDGPRRTALLRRVVVLALATVVAVSARLLVGSPTIFTATDNPAAFASNRVVRWATYLYYHARHAWFLANPYAPLCADWAGDSIPLLASPSDSRHAAGGVLLLATGAILALALKPGSSSAGASASMHRHRALLFGLALLLLYYLPSSNLFFAVGFAVAERVLYAPSLGFCLLFGVAITLVWDVAAKPSTDGGRGKRSAKVSATAVADMSRWQQLVAAGLAVLLALCAKRLVDRNDDWRDERSLFGAAVQVNPTNVRMVDAYAGALERVNPSEAERLYKRAMALRPTNAKVNTNYGRWLVERQRYGEAEPLLRVAVKHEHRVGQSKAAMNLGAVLTMTSRFREAEDVLAAAVQKSPKNARLLGVHGALHISLAQRLTAESEHDRRKEHLDRAVELLRRSLDSWPGFPDARYNLGMAMERQGDYRAALDQFIEFDRRERARSSRPSGKAAKDIARLKAVLRRQK